MASPAVTRPADLRLILSVQALRAAGYGFGSVLLGTSLAAAGLSGAQVGLVFAAMLAGMAWTTLAVGLLARRVGRRRLYLTWLAVLGASAVVFASTTDARVLVLAALAGGLSTDPNESGPLTTLEQAMLGGAPAAQRARVFGRYNAVAYLAGAAGALLAGGPALLRPTWPGLPADQRWLLALAGLAVPALWLASRLGPGVEAAPAPPVVATLPAGSRRRPWGAALPRSGRLVGRLAGLFAVDAFAGGFVVQAFLAYWLHARFGVGPEVAGAVFAGVGVLQAGASVAAGALGARIGLLPTMVFTHLPSNLLLAFVPLVPTLPAAVVLLLARSALSQMDVPARQAYVVSVVAPDERVAASAYTNMARYLTRPLGPALGGLLVSAAGLAAPFLVAGALKVGYDLVLWRWLRHIPLVEDGTAT